MSAQSLLVILLLDVGKAATSVFACKSLQLVIGGKWHRA